MALQKKIKINVKVQNWINSIEKKANVLIKIYYFLFISQSKKSNRKSKLD